MTHVLLQLAPALLLALVLALGRYPGSEALARVLQRRRCPRRRAAVLARPPRADRRRRPRGGALLARALAGRAPPEAVA